VDTVAGGIHRAELALPGPVTADLLTRVAAVSRTGIDGVLMAGLVTALGEWRRKRGRNLAGGVLIDVEGHGRIPLTDDMDLTRTVGWFTSAQPVRLDPGPLDYAQVRAGGAAAGILLGRIATQLAAVPGDGLGYGMLRHLNQRTAGALAEVPAAQVGFNYLGRFAAGTPDDDRAWQPAGDEVLGGAADGDTPAAHVLEAGAVVRDRPGGPELTISLACPAGLFDLPTIRRLTDGWAAMLTGLAAHRPDPGTAEPAAPDLTLAALAPDQLETLQIKLSGETTK
jgi:non-ribosomal peptide synthase protein (TIGR01720 family)